MAETQNSESLQYQDRLWPVGPATFDFSFRNLMMRMRVEWVLLRKRWIAIVLMLFQLVYVCGVLFRNIAFYYHHRMDSYVVNDSHRSQAQPQLLKTLHDLGHQHFPDLSYTGWALGANEWLYCVSSLYTLLPLLLVLFLKARDDGSALPSALMIDKERGESLSSAEGPGVAAPSPLPSPSPSVSCCEGNLSKNIVFQNRCTELGEIANLGNINATSIITRFLSQATLLHSVRIPFYLGTSLPGCAKHCVDYALEQRNRPTSLWNAVTSFGRLYDNCGDLLYSGHMCLTGVMLFTTSYYLTVLFPRVFYAQSESPTESKFSSRSKRRTYAHALLFKVFVPLVLCTQGFFAIATHNHYTADVILGGIAAYVCWVWHRYVFLPHDMGAEDLR